VHKIFVEIGVENLIRWWLHKKSTVNVSLWQ